MTDTTDSYGAIVLEKSASGTLQVLLIPGKKGLSFPKGHIEPDETPKAAAIRETKEETGIDISVDTGFCACVDSARPGDRRHVFFFLGRSKKGIVKPEPMMEVKEAGWFPCDEALGLVGYPPDRKALEEAIAYRERMDRERNNA